MYFGGTFETFSCAKANYVYVRGTFEIFLGHLSVNYWKVWNVLMTFFKIYQNGLKFKSFIQKEGIIRFASWGLLIWWKRQKEKCLEYYLEAIILISANIPKWNENRHELSQSKQKSCNFINFNNLKILVRLVTSASFL